MPKSRLRQLFKFIRVFGFTGGVRLWCALLLQLSFDSAVLKLDIPGLSSPIHLRQRDLPIFWQIMVMQENDLQSSSQASRVGNIYKGILSELNKPVIVDCGGHIGLSAVWFASRFPDAVVYTIEPDASNFEFLQKNTKAYKNVIPLHGGVWSESCRLKISNPLSGSASFRLQEVSEFAGPEKSDSLRGYTLDEIVLREEANRLFLVKIDIEGAESEVFRASAPWLQSVTVLIIELHDWLFPGQGTSQNFFKRLAENDFDVVLRGENLILFQIPNPVITTDRFLQAQAVVTHP